MAIYRDVTLTISSASAVFPGDPEVEMRLFARLAEEGFNASALSMSLHTGTHVDAPRHLFDGARGTDSLPLKGLIGPVRVLDCRTMSKLNRDLLERDWQDGTERLLLQTGGGASLRRGEVDDRAGFLTGDGADFLVGVGVKLVGIDALSIDALDDESLPAHRRLLENGVVIVEGLYLEEIEAGDYDLICLPIKIESGDGAPARVLLLER